MPKRCVLSFSELPTSGVASRQTYRQTHRPTQHPGHDGLALTKDASTTQGPTHASMINADSQNLGSCARPSLQGRMLDCRSSPQPRTTHSRLTGSYSSPNHTFTTIKHHTATFTTTTKTPCGAPLLSLPSEALFLWPRLTRPLKRARTWLRWILVVSRPSTRPRPTRIPGPTRARSRVSPPVLITWTSCWTMESTWAYSTGIAAGTVTRTVAGRIPLSTK